jgi:hypothetical protein
MIRSTPSAARTASRSRAVSAVDRNGRRRPSRFPHATTLAPQRTAPERPVPRWSTKTMSLSARSGSSSSPIGSV